jgi:glycerol-3-phosphate dehydrogenase (NAD(P)+)
MNLSVVGAGSWGTALAQLFSEKFDKVLIWDRNEEVVNSINKKHRNSKYFSEYQLNKNISASLDLNEVFNFGDLIIIVIPVQSIREVLKNLSVKVDKPIITASKGIEIETLKLPSDIIIEVLNISYKKVMALSGPSFAKEVIKNLPTAVTLAGEPCIGEKTQETLNLPHFRVYLSFDIRGAEVGGAVKNVIAIATGISDGLGLGNNARASLITRGLHEMKKIATIYNANPQTLYGLSGMGDLVLTATGELSRNRKFGILFGQGKPLEVVLKEVGQVVEGIETVKAIKRLQEKYDLDLPISEAVYKTIYEGLDPKDAVKLLMKRELKREFF